MKKLCDVNRYVKRKIATALIAAMLIDAFPVAGYAEPLYGETEAVSVMDEQTGFEEAIPEEPAENDQEAVSYIDGEGQLLECDSYTVLTGDETSLSSGCWYVVKESITYDHSINLNEQGEYHIILADGKTMNIGTETGRIGSGGSEDGVGLGCSNDSDRDDINLTIYGQSQGTGRMNIYNRSDSNDERTLVGDAINVDELTINGGELTLDVTGSGSCGISSKNLTVNGGNIICKATRYGGYAINSAGDITINGGTVTANTTGTRGYAIYSSAGKITINSGSIDACTSDHDSHAIYGENDVTINSGTVTAVTEDYDASGIKSQRGNITINDGEVKAEAKGGGSRDENYGLFGRGGVNINGGKVDAKGSRAGIRSDYGGNGAVSLSWKNETDYVKTNSFFMQIHGNITIAPGKAFTDSEGNYYVASNASKVKDLTNVTLSATTDMIHTVSFDCGGYPTVPPAQLVKDGNRAAKPADPVEGITYNDKNFAGWYQDTGYQIRYDFTSEVTSDLYLHAKWATRSTDINDASVKMIYQYKNGAAIDPVVENNIGETLKKGTDYDIVIKSEKTGRTVNNMTNAGFYKLTVTGKNTYSGTVNDVRVCVLTFEKYDPSEDKLKTETLPDNTDAAVVTDSTVIMNSGWYVVTEDVKAQTRMVVKGDVHLVLCDGATLDAAGNDGKMGISVTEGNSLTIYSQAGNTGTLLASSDNVNYFAGIGGDTAFKPDGKTEYPFPYLKGTENGNAGNITIHGGEIITKGSPESSAIGMAWGGKGGKITIYGGKITAERYYGANGSGDDTGIGGVDADIHISWCRDDDFVLSDGYEGNVSFDKLYMIEDTSIIAGTDNIDQAAGKKILPVTSSEFCTVTFDSNDGPPVESQTLAKGRKATKPVTPIRQGYRFEGWFRNSDLSGSAYDFTTPVDSDLILYAKWTRVEKISYIITNTTISNFRNYSPMEADYTVLPSGSYYIDKDVELLNRIKVTGEVNLILGDGYTLTADEGISVMGENNILNIFARSKGDNAGVISANAASDSAAIGGDAGNIGESNGETGNINIYGGIIRVQGGFRAAGIGGGRNNKYYGNICIYGGAVSGLGGNGGAAIGGGGVNNALGKDVDGTVEIHGGKVTVGTGHREGTGIGGGLYCYGGNISILGGQVHVTAETPPGEEQFIGIGDGYRYKYAADKKSRITLGCTGQDDFIYSERYSGDVRVAPYQTLIIENTSNTFSGDISDLTEIKEKKLVHSHTHNFEYTVNGSTVTAKCTDEGCSLHNTPAILTLSAPDAMDLVYDGTRKTVTVTDEYGIIGDSVVLYEKWNGDSWGEVKTTALKDVGKYRASITLADTGHGTATVNIEYTIIKRDVTIGGLIANDKIYDATTTTSVNDTAMVLENKIDGDNVVIIPGSADFATADVGENKTVTFTGYTLGGTAAENYDLVSQPASMTAAIERRPITIKANDQTVQIGDSITEMAATFDHDNNNGLLVDSGHALTALTLTPDPDPRFAAAPVENGTITAAGAVIKNRNTGKDVTDNYDITYVNGSLKIIMIRAKVTKHPVPRTNLKYDYYTVENYYDAEANTTRRRIVGQALVDPGEAETRMEYKVEQISRGKGELLKNKDGSYVRDNEAPTEGYTNRYDAWEAGSYHVWYRAASDDSHAPGEPICLNVDIAQVPLNVRPVDETIVYGERFPSMNAVVTGLVVEYDMGRLGARVYYHLVDGKWRTGNETMMTRTYPDPGTYSVSVNYDGEGEASHCYDIHCVPGFLTVVPRTVRLNWTDTSFTYDGKIHAPTVTLSNLSENEVPGAVDAVVAGGKINAGHYTAAAVGLSGEKAAKYALPTDNTIDFSIAKADYLGNIPNVEVSVPVSAETITASMAGKMPRDAGELTYSIGTVSANGFDYAEGGITAKVDKNGRVTVNIDKELTDEIEAGNRLLVYVNVDSTNYNRESIAVEATFVDKTDAGVRITGGDSVSVNFGETDTLTLEATVDCPDTGGTWTWESSDPEVAGIMDNNSRDCSLNITGVGTTAITVKYDSDTAIGYATMILTVNPISVPIPEAVKGLSYNGHLLRGVASDDTLYTLTGETGTKPGNYLATATLIDTRDHRWSDGTIDVKYIPWTIEKKTGPAAPTGLMGINPTTLENIDGKITGVNTDMEYSKDAAFDVAFPCTGNEIIGLTPGIWYVRVRETDTVKAGASAAVEIVAVAPPVVRPINGLVYNGSPQVLVTADKIPAGEIYYATAGVFDAKPDANRFTTTIPTQTNAGKYRVYYEIRGAGEITSSHTDVTIAQMDLRKDRRWISASFNCLYGSEGMIDLRDHVAAEDVRFGGIYHVAVIADTWGLFDGRTSGDTIDLVENYKVYYKVSEDKCFPETKETRIGYLTVSMDEMQNYCPFNLTVGVHVHKECPTNHADTEMLVKPCAPTCTSKGYTGDIWCHDCHAIIRGEEIPIDPDAHDFDYSNGDVTTPPTHLTWGWHTYHCIHDHDHTITKKDIPPLPSDDGVDYSDFVEDTQSLSGDAAVRLNETTDPQTGEITTTVKVGGDEVSKIVKDPVSGKETVESKIWVTGLQSSYTYTGSAIKPSFHVYDGTRKLTEKRDYSVRYKNNKEAGTAKIFLKFKGNFKGKKKQTINFSIVPAVLGRDILAYDTGVAVKNRDQKPVPVLLWASTGKAVSSKFFTVSYDGADYVREEGTYTATIASKNKNYEGTAKAKVKVVGKTEALLSKAKVKFSPKSYDYTGSAIIPAKGSYTLNLGGRELIEGVDYSVIGVMNNIDPGTATVVFEGLGTKIATFKITGTRKLQEAGKKSDFTYRFSESVPYVKGGAKPGLIIRDKGVTLKEGKDYTLSYANNKAVTGDKKAEIKVKGKGKYKGSVILKFDITQQSLGAEGITIEAADQFTTLKKLKKPSVTVTDTDGKKLKEGVDYTVGEADLSAAGNTDERGEVFITVTGKGNYCSENSVKTSFRYMAASSNLSRTKKMKNIADHVYTGSRVSLGDGDLSEILYTGSKSAPVYLVPGKDFVVDSYKNNLKKGTAKVILKGIDGYGGTKTLDFRIKEKEVDYKGVLMGETWQ